jgi:hypothetical protein
MAVDEERIKSVASWGFLGTAGGEAETQIIEGPIEVTFELTNVPVELD